MNPPVILVQPADQLNLTQGSDVTFSVTVSGSLLSYQWQKDGVDIVDLFNTYSGTNTSTLTIQTIEATDEGAYSVVVTNAAVPSGVISDSATLQLSAVCELNIWLVLACSIAPCGGGGGGGLVPFQAI